jgi:hypothetical protein
MILAFNATGLSALDARKNPGQTVQDWLATTNKTNGFD